MTNLNKFLAAVFLAVFASSAMAELKVGVVDLQRALFASNIAKSSYETVQTQFADDFKKAEELQNQLKGFNEKIKNDGAIMSDDEKRKLQSDFAKSQEDLKFVVDRIQRAEQAWRQQLTRATLPALNKLIQDIAKEEKLDMVLRAETLVFAQPSMDVTKILIEKLNKMASDAQAAEKEKK